ASSSWFCDGCTATTVLVIMRPFRPRHTGADQAAYTLTATVPPLTPLIRQTRNHVGEFARAPALLISRLVSWVDDLWCRAIGAGV
ncbi:hypothetical protein OSI00_26440, partial [Mycobacterium ulcerans]